MGLPREPTGLDFAVLMQAVQIQSLVGKPRIWPQGFWSWESPWSEDPGGLEPMGLQKGQTRLRNSATTTMITSSDVIGRWFGGVLSVSQLLCHLNYFLLFIQYFSVYLDFNLLNTFLENKIVLLSYLKKAYSFL